jgi:hypothetical protein
MIDPRPGSNLKRMCLLIEEAVERCRLDLRDFVVFTEAASGPYVVTPVLAALAGANTVHAVCRSTRYGTIEDISARTLELASLLGVEDRIHISSEKKPEVIATADIITNSGHVRPIDAKMISWMKPGAVVPLMYESWEFREADIDLAACERSDIRVAGTNERHPAVDVFSFLGIMAIKQLIDAGIPVYSNRILVLCDNPFSDFIERGLRQAGADVSLCMCFEDADLGRGYDAVLVALHPQRTDVVTASQLEIVLKQLPGTAVVQYWGDIDRSALERNALVWPKEAPPRGHMGILPSGVGPDPIIRLQSGGLKVGEVLARGDEMDAFGREFLQIAPQNVAGF